MKKIHLAFLVISGFLINGAALAVVPQSVNAAAQPPAAAEKDLDKFQAAMDASKAGIDREAMPGAGIYKARCQSCHEGQAPKAPSRTFIEMMSAESVHRALTVGIMQQQAAGLTDADKRHVAEYLSGSAFGAPATPGPAQCIASASKFDVSHAPDISGWGFDEGNSHFIPGAVANLKTADIPRLKVKWALAYPSAVRARSRPTFAFGAVYFGSQNGVVYALDAKTGCKRWTFETSAEVRTPVTIPAIKGPSHIAYFGDIIGRVYAIDALTGRELWRHKVDDHPSATVTGAPVYHNGMLYIAVSSLEEATANASYPCCTFRGSIVALNAVTGERLWKYYTISDLPKQVGTTKVGTKIFAPSGAAVWNTPTVDAKRGLLYFGTGNNYTGPANDRSNSVVALDLKTGAVKWSWQVVAGDAWNVGCMIGLDSCPANSGPDADIGSGTMLVKLQDGSDRIFVGLKSGTVMAIDPDMHTGSLWSNRVGRGSIQGGVQFGMAFDSQRLYVPISDMANTGDASQAERDATLGPSRPGLYALNPIDGKLLWQTAADDICAGRAFCDSGILASIAAIPGAVFAGHMDGRVRAYESNTGKVLWQFDTSASLPTLGGGNAHGGSIGGGGPVIHNGMVYVNSGYGLYAHMPGNLLVAFSVDGK